MSFNRDSLDVFNTGQSLIAESVGDIRGVAIVMTLDRALDKFCLQM